MAAQRSLAYGSLDLTPLPFSHCAAHIQASRLSRVSSANLPFDEGRSRVKFT